MLSLFSLWRSKDYLTKSEHIRAANFKQVAAFCCRSGCVRIACYGLLRTSLLLQIVTRLASSCSIRLSNRIVASFVGFKITTANQSVVVTSCNLDAKNVVGCNKISCHLFHQAPSVPSSNILVANNFNKLLQTCWQLSRKNQSLTKSLRDISGSV